MSDRSVPADLPDRDIAWPACGQCGARQQAVCPFCGTAGSDFAFADSNELSAPLSPIDGSDPEEERAFLLLCSICDEPFPLRTYRFCPRCGRDAGQGIQVDLGQQELLTRRALSVAIGLMVLGWTLFAYFAYILRE